MGFQNYRAFNEAMLACHGWRLIMNPQTFWASYLKGIYFPNSSFLQASRGSHASWAWLSLLHGRNLFPKGLRWLVKKGRSNDPRIHPPFQLSKSLLPNLWTTTLTWRQTSLMRKQATGILES